MRTSWASSTAEAESVVGWYVVVFCYRLRTAHTTSDLRLSTKHRHLTTSAPPFPSMCYLLRDLPPFAWSQHQSSIEPLGSCSCTLPSTGPTQTTPCTNLFRNICVLCAPLECLPSIVRPTSLLMTRTFRPTSGPVSHPHRRRFSCPSCSARLRGAAPHLRLWREGTLLDTYLILRSVVPDHLAALRTRQPQLVILARRLDPYTGVYSPSSPLNSAPHAPT
jgi:hypothetical protein